MSKNEPELGQHEVQVTSLHRLHFDKQNITLTRQYQKRAGKGKGSPFIDEYGYNEPTYYSNPKALFNRLLDKEFMEGLSDKEIADLHEFKAIVDHAIAHIDKVKEEIFEYTKDKFVIDLGEKKKLAPKRVKGVEVYEEEKTV